MKTNRVQLTLGLFFILATLLTVEPVFGQRGDRPTAPSPNAKVSQTIGAVDVDMHFSRPGVKGRTIFGDLEAFGKVWRAGANEPTSITFSTDVMIEGQSLPAGEYALWITPMESGPWTVAFGSMVGWGTQSGNSEIALSVEVDAEEAPHEEWMSYSFEDLSTSSATLVMRWAMTKLPVVISVGG